MEQALQQAASKPKEVRVLFADEASFYRQPTQGWLWGHMGRRQPSIRYNSSFNTVMRVVGLMDAATARVDVWDFDRVTSEKVASCFRHISSLYPDAKKIYLVMDNWVGHFHNKVRAVLQAQPRIQLLPLPTYSPWLNNIEKLWRCVKQRVIHAHPWSDDFRVFRQQVLDEFKRLQSGSPELRRYCGLDHLFCS